jgi:hypothetical protein
VNPYAVLSFLAGDQLWNQEEFRDLIGRVAVPRPPDIEILETEPVVVPNGDGMESSGEFE